MPPSTGTQGGGQQPGASPPPGGGGGGGKQILSLEKPTKNINNSKNFLFISIALFRGKYIKKNCKAN